MITGAHESVAGGLDKAFGRAKLDGCAALQIFTKNGSQWKEPVLTDKFIRDFHAAHAEVGNLPVLAHASYLINLATMDDELRKRSKDALVAEVQRSSALGIQYVVLHPGAHNGIGEDEGLAIVCDSLTEVLGRTEGERARILIENTAGQGTTLGCRFEHLAVLFDGAKPAGRMGVCFDTQHAFASGYDLSTDAGYDKTFQSFDSIVGLPHLMAFHLNDSKKPLGSRVDRHEHIGDGNLGYGTFWHLANDPRFKDIPGVLETEPAEGELAFRDEVTLVRGFAGAPRPAPKVAAFSLQLSPAPTPAPRRR